MNICYCVYIITGRFQPANGQFTVTANVGELVTLEVEVVETPEGLSPNNDILWHKQSDTYGQFESSAPTGNGPIRVFNPVSVTDAGVYATHWRGHRSNYQFSLIRLIVRGNLYAIIV